MVETKRILRSKNDYVVAGVCGGIAEYFKLDPIIIRIIFIILGITGGSGVLIYIILWAFLPIKDGEKNKDLPNMKEVKEKMGNRSFLGLIILLLGIVALLNEIQPNIIRWEICWPIILIVTGLFFIFKKKD